MNGAGSSRIVRNRITWTCNVCYIEVYGGSTCYSIYLIEYESKFNVTIDLIIVYSYLYNMLIVLLVYYKFQSGPHFDLCTGQVLYRFL